MNITLPVDSAVIVPINTVPLVDDTDYKTIEDALTYNQAGLDLVWNFLTTAGVLTQTAVTPTESAGDYDWQNKGNGMYGIEIPASGGVSINNDTEGYGWFTGYATGVLPWRGPTISFVPANVVDALVAGSDYLQIDVLQVKGSGTYGTNLYNACANYSATRGLAGTALPDAAADAAGGLPISDAGGLDLDAILADTNELQTNQGNWLTATGFSTHSAADVVTALGTGSTLTDCATATGFSTLDAAGVRSAIGMAAANLDLKFMAITTHITNTTQDVNVTTIGGETVTAAGGIVVGAYVGQAAVGPTKSEMNSAFTEIKGDTYVQATDSLEALRDRGDSAWVTGGAGSVTVSPIAGTYEQVNFGPLVITDTDGDAVSLSGVDLALVVFPLNGDTTEVWRWTTTDSELTVSGDDNNQITISDDATHTQAIGAWAWVLWDTTNDYPKQYGGTLAVKRCASPDAS